MKVNLPILTATFVSAAAFLIASDPRLNPPAGLTVHEWGTFTSVAGEDGRAVEWDTLGGNDDLPGFVVRGGYRCTKVQLTGTVRMETPVLYFYSAEPLVASVKVAFPKGVITEWYPPAADSHPSFDPSFSVTGGIEWNGIQVRPGADPSFPTEKAPSHYYAARSTAAAPVMVNGKPEKFLFYRGVSRTPVPLSARVLDDGKIAIENRANDPIPSVILFENRGSRIGYTAAGPLYWSANIDPPSLGGDFESLRQELESTLVRQGLFQKEAHAMVETWRDSWFEEGSRLIYILPAASVDAMLPLHVEPAPQRTARVFVGRMELITPATRAAVEQAIARKDMSILQTFGRFMEPILQRIGPRAEAGAFRLRINQQFANNCR